jgi:hypothetical protein
LAGRYDQHEGGDGRRETNRRKGGFSISASNVPALERFGAVAMV